jgi:hypothetical protein
VSRSHCTTACSRLARVERTRITPGRLALGVAIAALWGVVVHYI